MFGDTITWTIERPEKKRKTEKHEPIEPRMPSQNHNKVSEMDCLKTNGQMLWRLYVFIAFDLLYDCRCHFAIWLLHIAQKQHHRSVIIVSAVFSFSSSSTNYNRFDCIFRVLCFFISFFLLLYKLIILYCFRSMATHTNGTKSIFCLSCGNLLNEIGWPFFSLLQLIRHTRV